MTFSLPAVIYGTSGAPVAQRIEQLPSKQRVGGSIPSRGTIQFFIERKRLDAIDGLQVQAPGRHATTQGYYLYAVKVDPAKLKDGITRKEVLEALQAEGLAIWTGWGKVMYKQTLWSVPENLYRICSSDVAERIVTQELMCMPLNTLMLSEEETEKEADCFEKVMSEYAR